MGKCNAGKQIKEIRERGVMYLKSLTMREIVFVWRRLASPGTWAPVLSSSSTLENGQLNPRTKYYINGLIITQPLEGETEKIAHYTNYTNYLSVVDSFFRHYFLCVHFVGTFDP